MKLLCHRGLWTDPADKNTLGALRGAFDQGFGIETDVRDCDGELVISHDMPTKAGALTLKALLKAYNAAGRWPLLALNIKADGLQQRLQAELQKHRHPEYFVFDMSVPDTLGYRRQGMHWAARLSEYEPHNPLLAQAGFIWLDAFEREWYGVELIETLLSQGKHVAVVSPELHKRSHRELWAALKGIKTQDRLHLCTDFYQEALETFDVERD